MAILGAAIGGAQLAGVGPVSSATAAEPAHDRYVQENEGRLEEWGRRMDEWSREAQRKGEHARREAERQLDRAWADAKKQWQALKDAGAAGWNEAKDAYEKSLKRLETAWDDVQT